MPLIEPQGCNQKTMCSQAIGRALLALAHTRAKPPRTVLPFLISNVVIDERIDRRIDRALTGRLVIRIKLGLALPKSSSRMGVSKLESNAKWSSVLQNPNVRISGVGDGNHPF